MKLLILSASLFLSSTKVHAQNDSITLLMNKYSLNPASVTSWQANKYGCRTSMIESDSSIKGIPLHDFLKLFGQPDLFGDGYGGRYDCTKSTAVCLYNIYRECKEEKPIVDERIYSFAFIFEQNKLTGISIAIID